MSGFYEAESIEKSGSQFVNKYEKIIYSNTESERVGEKGLLARLSTKRGLINITGTPSI